MPMPVEPKLSLPGLALAWATSSCAVRAGTRGLTTSTCGWLAIRATGVKSRTGS